MAWRVLTFVLAVGLVHALAVWPLPWEAGAPDRALALPQPDVLFLLAAVAIVGGQFGLRRTSAHLAALLLILSVLYRAAATGVELYLDKPFTLFELRHVAALHHLLLDHRPAYVQVLTVVWIGLGLVVLQLALAWAFARVARAAVAVPGAALILLAILGAVLAGAAVKSRTAAARSWWHPSQLTGLVDRVRDDSFAWLDTDARRSRIRAGIDAASAALDQAAGNLDRLGGADVYLVFLESYGHLLHHVPDLAARQRGLWTELGPALGRSGFTARSAWCHPEVYGFSWLAHAQLLAGMKVPTQETSDLLLRSALRPLPARFRDNGWRTVEVLPAVDKPWPEGMRFYGFDEQVTQQELGYQGMVYGFGWMPDQYSLQHLLQHHVRTATQPLFATFVSVSSHAPWERIPPYVEDWQSIGPTTFSSAVAEHKLTWTNLRWAPEAFAAYEQSIHYSLRVLVGFLEQLHAIGRPSLVLVVGDHQPPIRLSAVPPDLGKDVLFHAFANRSELLAPFEALGFTPGVEPDAQPGSTGGSFPTDQFAAGFLRAFRR